MTHPSFSSRGQALVEVLVASGIVLIIMTALVTMLQTQTQETRALAQKVNAIELQRALTLLIADSSVCQSMITAAPLKISGSNLTGTLTSVPSSAAPGAGPLITAGQPVSTTARDLVVDRIAFEDVTPSGTANQYLAWLRVSFATDQLVRPIRPVAVRFTLTTDASGSVTGCITNGNTSPNGPAGPTSPGGKCMNITKAMVRGQPGVATSGAWSSMILPCPGAYPVAASTSTTPAAYAPAWNSRYQTSSSGGYFNGGICDISYLRDTPAYTPMAAMAYAGQPIDQGACTVQCCNL